MALKNVTIELRAGGVSASIWAGFSPTEKSNYLASLSGLSSSSYANARWIISSEVYIPSGTTLSIPVNVTLVAYGGVLSGVGNLNGNQTKIEAQFEQLFEDTINLGGTWNVNMSHPEWFGDGSETVDCSKKIQKAANLIAVGHNDSYVPNYPVSGFFTKGGKIVCKPYSKYLITQTINLSVGHSFDGGNSNFIYGITSTTERFMFKLNLNSSGTSVMLQAGQWDAISNLRLINPKLINKAYGIYCASQICSFENIYSEYLFQTFRRYSTDYLDQITVRNFLVAWPQKSSDESLYQIDMGYIGDNLFVDNVHTFVKSNASTGEQGNELLLKINGCGGGVVQRLINGSIYIANSKSLVVSGLHQEFGNITIENSQVEINGWCHFKKPGVSALKITKRPSSNEQRVVSVKNTMFLYNHRGSVYTPSELDIEVPNIAVLKLENVTRSAHMPWTEGSSLYGIKINHKSFMLNSANHSLNSLLSGAGIVDASEETMLNDIIAYKVKDSTVIASNGVFASTATDVTTTFFGQTGTFTYYASIVFDKDRNIGGNYEAFSSSVNVDSQTRCVYIGFWRSFYMGMTIRLYRKKSGTSTVDYIDIPVCTSHNLFFDLGTCTLFGEAWTTIPDGQKVSVQKCSQYQMVGNNAVVTMASRPTSGKWNKGDIINLPNERLIYGYGFTL